MKTLIYFLIFIIISNCNNITYGNDIDFNIKRYTYREGLPDNHVRFIIKDNKEFLWVITGSGISRFDGNTFYTFPKERFNADKVILFKNGFQLNEDEILFIANNGELWCYKYSTGKFENLSFNNKLSEYHFRIGIKSNSGKLWFSVSGGLLELHNNLTIVKFHPFKELTEDTKKYFNPYSIKEDKNGNLWMTYYPIGIIKFNTKSNEYEPIKNSKLKDLNFYNFSFSPDGNHFYSVSEFGTFIKININNNLLEILTKEKIFGNKTVAVQHTEIYSDSLLIIAANNGIFLLNINNYKYQYLVNNPDNINSISSNNIERIFVDSNRLIWLCAVNALNQLTSKENNFSANEIFTESGIVESKYEIIYTHKDEKYIWYLTTNGFIIKDKQNGKHFHYLKNIRNSFANLAISRFLLKDSDDNYWIATWGDGLIRFNIYDNFTPGDNIKFDIFLFNENDSTTINGNHVSHIVEDEFGNIWIGLWNSGLSFLSNKEKSKSNPKFKRIQNKYGYNIPGEYISNLFIDKFNKLWMTSDNGLLRMDTQNYNFERIFINKSDPTSEINFTQFISKDIDGGFVIGSFKEISKIDFDENGKVNIKILDIPFSSRLLQLYVDKNGIIWFGTNHTILYSYDRISKNLMSFDIESEINGFSFGFSFPSSDSEGNLYFKALQFNPGKIIINKIPPKIYLSSILINNNEYYFEKDPSLINELKLNYIQNNLLIKYSSINYVKSELNQFAYRIKNKNSFWTYTTKPEIFLAALEPGEYILELNGANNDGVWSDRPIELSIIISPPYWQTNIFRITFFIIIAVITYITLRKRYIRIRKDRENIQRFAQRLIKTQEDERSRVAKDLHDSIGQNLLVLKNLFSLYQKNINTSKEDIEKLNNLITESIDEVRNISSSLHPHQLRRLGFKTAIESMINKLNNSSINGVSFTIENEIEELKEPYDIIVYRIVQETINNIIKHSEATYCNIKIFRINNMIELSVKDNGKGFDINTQYGGLGLIGIRERAAYIDGKLIINSSDKGTILTLTFEEK